MKRVILDKYSKHWDAETDTQFQPILNKQTGLYIGCAEVSEEKAEQFAERPAFRVIDDAEYLALITTPAPAPKPVVVSQSGDPLEEAATNAVQKAAEGPDKTPPARTNGPTIAPADKANANGPTLATDVLTGPPPPPAA